MWLTSNPPAGKGSMATFQKALQTAGAAPTEDQLDVLLDACAELPWSERDSMKAALMILSAKARSRLLQGAAEAPAPSGGVDGWQRPISLTMRTLGGDEEVALAADAGWTRSDVITHMRGEVFGWRAARVKFLIGEHELSGATTLGDLGLTDGSQLTVIVSQSSSFVCGDCKDDGGGLIWDLESDEVCGLCQGSVYSCAVSRDGSRILTCSTGFAPTVKIWDAVFGECLFDFQTPEGSGPDLVVTTASSIDDSREVELMVERYNPQISLVRVWGADPGGECLAAVTLKGNQRGVAAAICSPDGTRVVTDRIHSARIWDADSGERLVVLFEHFGAFNPDGTANGEVKAMAFSPDGTRVIIGSNFPRVMTGTAIIWDANSGLQRCELRPAARVTSVAFSPDGTRALTGVAAPGERLAAKIWDADSGAELLTLCDEAAPSSALSHFAAFSESGTRVAALCVAERRNEADSYPGECFVQIWDAQTGECSHTLRSDRFFIRDRIPPALSIR